MNALYKTSLLICAMILLWGLPDSKAQNPSDIRRTYHWYFGNGAGLDFSSGDPVPLTDGAMTAEEGCATISDTCGDLLFYTDGDTVWNKNHQVMPNSTGLMGCWSSTQSSLIVPQPGNDSIYYIFLTDCGENLAANGLRYSVVNMNVDGGMGSVIEKNTLVFAPAMEKLAATYHANGNDIWVLSVNVYPTGPPPPDTTYQYYAYLLKANGLNSTPVLSSSSIHPHKTVSGYLRFSHTGDKVANAISMGCSICIDTTEILDFNSATGILSNPVLLGQDSTDFSYGLVFSPDDSKLYATMYNLTQDYPGWYSKIYQYDLSSGDSAIIASSRSLIQLSDTSNTANLPQYLGLQTGPDGKIYIAHWNNMGNSAYSDTIGLITDPNVPGLACNFVAKGQYTGNDSHAGFPNFVDSYLQGPWQPVCSVGIEENKTSNGFSVFPNPATEFLFIDNTYNTKPSEIKLYNFLGALILQRQISSPEKIDIQTLPSGIYFLQVENQNSMSNFNIIKP